MTMPCASLSSIGLVGSSNSDKLCDQRNAKPRASEMITGESHYVWGLRYSLTVLKATRPTSFTIEGNRLVMCARAGSTPESRLRHLQVWQRQQTLRKSPGTDQYLGSKS